MQISQRLLLIISITIIVCGLPILYISTQLLEDVASTYTQFLEEDEDVIVVLRGTIANKREIGNTTIGTLITTCNIPIVSFSESFTTGPARIIGEKRHYKGKPEVIVQKIIYE